MSLPPRLRLDRASRALAGNAASLVGTTAITAGLGFVYWWLAARSFAVAEVGLATSAISAMTLIATVAASGSGSFLIGELARGSASRGRLIAGASLAAGLGSALVALGYAAATPWISAELASLATPMHAAAFAGGTGLVAVGLTLDQALIGLLRGHVQMGRNALYALLKLALLAALPLVGATHDGFSIYATWAVGNVLSLVVVIVPLARLQQLPVASGARAPTVRRTFVAHHLVNLALQAPGLSLPVLAVSLISASVAAYFYIGWMLASFAFVAPVAVTTCLFAVAARAPEETARRLRFSLALSLAAGVAANAGYLLLGRQLLAVFGGGYSAQTYQVLLVLGLAVFPLTVKHHFAALGRVRQRLNATAAVLACGAVLEVGLAFGGGHAAGLLGLSAGWTVANVIQALAMAPVLVRAVAGARPADQASLTSRAASSIRAEAMTVSGEAG